MNTDHTCPNNSGDTIRDYVFYAMVFALSALREVGAMPAIAPIEDLRAVQKEG